MNEPTIEILLIEDNPDDVELTMHALRGNNLANTIHVARDGVEALEFLFGEEDAETLPQRPRLILLDLKLPKVDGLEVLARIKKDPRSRRIPVVIMTSSREESDLIESYDLGVNAYIRKPLDFARFTEAVKQIGLFWLLLNEDPPDPERRS